jgi:DNA-binding transcriptional ArsR family regulator
MCRVRVKSGAGTCLTRGRKEEDERDEMGPAKHAMPETMYRASRICRILGNPSAYLIVRTLERKSKTPGEMSRELKMSRPAVSATLRHLRQIDLVRYETRGREKEYRLKDTDVPAVLDSLERIVDSMRQKRK